MDKHKFEQILIRPSPFKRTSKDLSPVIDSSPVIKTWFERLKIL